MTASWQPVPASVNLARQGVLISYFGLLGLFTGKAIVNMVNGMPASVAIFLWLVGVLPLSIFIPGLRKNTLRTYAWLCFMILMYFLHAVTLAFSTGSLVYGLVYTLLCTLLFCTAVTYIKLAKKYLGQTLLS
jgi:uncharacterized membrane protein